MQEKIMNLFEQKNLKQGEIVPMNVIRQYTLKFNHIQLEEFNDSLKNLIDSGFITYEDGTTGIACLRLTDRGFNSLYADSLTIDQLKRKVLDLFYIRNSRTGHVLMRAFNNFMNLNPIENVRLVDAINSLQTDGYLTVEGNSDLRLTQSGEDFIYS
ncbi:hypothetical protein [Chryseobacterium camelliae]|uniref:hypothetical protein n=1 Tax=Chryseobacterium camelliae TaxID=1265445 RepID=UPI0012FE18DC|nr:hypothetical protein [Chryseobacterium camelliae]